MWFWDITGWILGVVCIILLLRWGVNKVGRAMACVLGAPLILIGYLIDLAIRREATR